jgi:hypothetical protein
MRIEQLAGMGELMGSIGLGRGIATMRQLRLGAAIDRAVLLCQRDSPRFLG